jgi:hypothetical protein
LGDGLVTVLRKSVALRWLLAALFVSHECQTWALSTLSAGVRSLKKTGAGRAGRVAERAADQAGFTYALTYRRPNSSAASGRDTYRSSKPLAAPLVRGAA